MPIQLSLICPVYKVAKYIPDLMSSLLKGINSAQVEVIFVNDCCPERSMDICEMFISENAAKVKFKPVFLRQSFNQGQAVARNAALKIAKGKYIGFIDSDDAIAEKYWQVLYPYVENSRVDIIEFGFQEFSSHLPSESNQPVGELPSSNFNPFYTGFFVWTRLYKRESFMELTFPVGMIYEDVFYNIHAFSRANSSIRLSSSLVYYRKRAGSTTAVRTSQYSQLLINLITAVEQTVEASLEQRGLVSLLKQRTLLSILKGLKISDMADRTLYYQLCYPKLLDVTKLGVNYGSSLKSDVAFRLACLICRVFK